MSISGETTVKPFLILSAITATTLLTAASAQADRREFVWTYQTLMQVPDAYELELYQTTRVDETNSWEYRIEIEHGLSPRWDISVYQIFTQAEGESFTWDAVQFRTRYRLSEPGTVPFDPILYLEYNRKIDFDRQNKLEAKVLFGEDTERWSVAVNPVYEFFWAPGDPVHEIGLEAGVSYELKPNRFGIGLESTTRHEFVSDAKDETGSYFGPTMSFASGGIYYTLGYAWGLTDTSNDARVRFLMGIAL